MFFLLFVYAIQGKVCIAMDAHGLWNPSWECILREMCYRNWTVDRSESKGSLWISPVAI